MDATAGELSNLLDCLNEIVYVIDTETYELLFANETAKRWKADRELEGQLCYASLNGFSEPCPWCFVSKMEDGDVHIDELQVPGSDMWLYIDSHAIDWRGRRAAVVHVHDITKTISDRVQRERERWMYEAAVEDAKLVVWEYDIVNHRVRMSENEFTEYDYRKFGLPKVTENVPESLVPYIDDDSVEAFRKLYADIDAGAPRASVEVWYKLKPGQAPRCERISYTTVFDKDGRPVSAVGIGQNVTAQRIERVNFDRAFQQLLDGSPGTLCSFKLNLTQNTCESGHSTSPFIQSLLAAATADKLFSNIASLISDPQDKAAFRTSFNRDALAAEFKEGHANVSAKYRRRMEDGAIHWVTTHINMVQNPYTSDIEAVASSVDVEDEAIEELIVRRVTNDTCDYIGTIDMKSRTFRFRNDSSWTSEFMAGYPTDYEACIEYDIAHFIVPDDAERYREELDFDDLAANLDGSGERFVNFRCVEHGETKHKSIRLGHLYGKKSDILLIQTDVTALYEEQQRQMERLSAALEAAKDADAAKSEFLSRMSHDIRTPLNGIIGMTHIAQEYDRSPQIEDCLHKIEVSSNFLLGLVNDILDMSKAESGKMELHLEPYLMAGFNEYVDSVIKPLYEERNQTFLVETHPVPTAVPIMDVLRFNQIIFNLLSNAVKYTPEGGTISLYVMNELVEGHKERITSVISDNGIGMSDEFQRVLFDPFTQEGRRDSSESKGSGLGLAIAKKMVDLMGGTISVESKLGQGTKFTVVIDFDYIEAEQDLWEKEHGAAPRDYHVLAGKHILLCEDHPLNQEIALHMLEGQDMVVSVAEDGALGLDAFEKSPPHFFDAILMDIRMPVMNGIEATKAIRALARPDAQTVPIIAMTADAYDEDVRECMAAGMNAHVAKPVDFDNLMRELAGNIR